MSKRHRNSNTPLARVQQQEKANPNYTVVMNGPSALPVMMPRNMKAYLNEGYRNKTAFRVVGQIARSGAGIKWKHYTDETKQREVKNSELLKLWNRPNAEQGGSKFRENMLGYYCLTGNSYVLGINASQNPNAKFDEMYCLRPDLTKVHINDQESIDYYEFGPSYPYKHYDKPFLMHSKLFAANDDVYGLSPIEVAAMLIDVQKASQKWNLSLMSNMAAPSGAWVTKQILNDPDYRNLKREIHEKFSGPRNAREPVILHGGVEWQSMSMTPMELDFLSSDEKTDRDIAGIFFNYPVFLLGVADATFANQAEAKHYLYTDIIFPIWDMFVDDINSWLTPRYGGYLDYDREDVETIQERIQAAKAQASDRAMAEWAAGTTTFHEARSIQGKIELPNKDFIILNGATVFVDQINEFVQASMDKVINPPPPPPQLLPAPDGRTTVTEVPPATDPSDDEEPDSGKEDGSKSTLARVIRGRSPLALPRYIQIQRTKALDLHTKEQKKAYFDSIEATRNKWIEQIQPRIADYFKDERKTVVAALQRSDDTDTADDRVTHALSVIEGAGTLKQVLVKAYQDVGTDVGDQVLKELKTDTRPHEHKGFISDFLNLFTPDILIYLLSMCAMKVKQISTTTVAQIRLELTDGVAQGESIPELAKRIDKLYLEQIIPNRSTVIARTEVVAASNYGSIEAAKQSGLTLNKVWLATEDSRTRPDHSDADGQEVAMDQPFDVGESQMMFPGDSSMGAAADEIIQCRCTVYHKRVEAPLQGDEEDTSKALKTYVLSLPEPTVSRDQYRELLKAFADKHGHHNQLTHGSRRKFADGLAGKSTQEKEAFFAKHGGDNWLKSLSSNEKKSIAAYTEEGYKKMNGTLREGGKQTKDIKDVQTALLKSKAPVDMVVKRAYGDDPELLSKFRGAVKSNKFFQEKGFASTTIKDQGDISFEGFKVNIHVFKGAPGAYVASLSDIASEREFLIPHGAEFKVVKQRIDERGEWEFDIEYKGTKFNKSKKSIDEILSFKDDTNADDGEGKDQEMSDKFVCPPDGIVWLDDDFNEGDDEGDKEVEV